MTEPLKVIVERRELETLLRRARECAEDLIVEVEQANPGNHPVTVRRRERDTETARLLLSELPDLARKYHVDLT
jgi:hypothetical protein